MRLSILLALLLPMVATADSTLPPMRFMSSIASEPLLEEIKKHPSLANIDDELYGSPINLLITHSTKPTPGGQAAGALTAVLAGGTLGLIPLVDSNNMVISYEIWANGEEVASFSFERKLTRATNMWSTKDDGTYGLGKEGYAWLLTTVEQFATQIQADARVAAMAAEYAVYFPPAPETEAPQTD